MTNEISLLEDRLKLPLFDWEKIAIERRIFVLKRYQKRKKSSDSVSLETKLRHIEIMGG